MKKTRSSDQGFTMIELMYVVVVIGILAAIAIPQFSIYRHRAIIVEGFALAEPVKEDILEYYAHVGEMPVDNASCGQPPAELISGKYVAAVAVVKGSIHIRFNQSFKGDCSGKTMKLRPEQQEENPSGIFTWQQEKCK